MARVWGSNRRVKVILDVDAAHLLFVAVLVDGFGRVIIVIEEEVALLVRCAAGIERTVVLAVRPRVAVSVLTKHVRYCILCLGRV